MKKKESQKSKKSVQQELFCFKIRLMNLRKGKKKNLCFKMSYKFNCCGFLCCAFFF